MQAQIFPAFAVPFASSELIDPGLNRELRQLILAREAEGDSQRNRYASMDSQPGLFESEFNFFASTEPCVQQLRRFCMGSLSQVLAELNGYTVAQLNQIEIQSHTWFHVTRYGGYFGLHNHPMASWSGVYCVDPGQENPSYPDSGVLSFSNPLSLANMFIDPGNAHLPLPYGHANYAVRFKAGQLLLFPSWVLHQVQPFFGADERITVAFNCWFKRKS